MFRSLAIVLVVISSVASAFGKLNVLVIGSTRSYSEGEKPDATHQRAFDAAAVADRFRAILANDARFRDRSSVVFEDIYRTKTLPTAVGGSGKMMPMEYHCHSLAQYYFWPEGRDRRFANLTGKGDTKWHFVVLIGDPYLIAQMPGVYAEGVNLMAAKVREGSAKPVLLMTWQEAGSPSTVAHFGEAAGRVGKGAGIPVAPAGLAWATLPNREKSPEHPGADGAFLAAACLFSEMSGQLAPGSDAREKALAAHALKTVKSAKAKLQFPEKFAFDSPFSMKYETKKNITFNHTGSSTENGIQGPLQAAIKRCGVGCKKVSPGGGAKVDFNYGRGNTIFEPNKKYKVAPDKFGRSYGLPMQDHSNTAAETMLYGIDKRYHSGRRYDDGTDLGIAYDMVRQGEVPSDIRAIPIRLMWAKLRDADPGLKPLRDRWHMSRYLDEASGTYMYTLLSGNCPVSKEPSEKGSDAWNRWLGQKIGYETAWRMAHLDLAEAEK